MKKLAAFLLLIIAAAGAHAQGLPIKGGSSSDLAKVTTTGALVITDGINTRPTYEVSMGAQATTAAMTISIEASAGAGFKLAGFCVTSSAATAAAKVDVVLQRRTAASSGGVACTNEFATVGGTGCAITKADPADSNYPGIGRNGGTAGTAGAVLGQWAFTVPEIGAGTADPAGLLPWCIAFDQRGVKLPTVAAGVANGLTIAVSAAGAGGLAAGAITAVVIAE